MSNNEMPAHFAFLIESSITSELEDSLSQANVRLVRYSDHREIPGLLKRVYLSAPDLAGDIAIHDRLKTTGDKFIMLTPDEYWRKLLLIKQYKPAGYDEA